MNQGCIIPQFHTGRASQLNSYLNLIAIWNILGIFLLQQCSTYPLLSIIKLTRELYLLFDNIYHTHTHTHAHNHFTALFPGPSGSAGARRERIDFMVQGKINRGKYTDHPAGRHSIRSNQCPPPPSCIFYMPDALPATQATASKHWGQLAHSD